jgi:SAM-dependent methyltransferase
MSKFDPESYLRSRIEYPKALFSPLASFVCLNPGPLRVIDLGAGTGLAARSFLNFYPYLESVTLIDPDPAMLAAAKVLNSKEKYEFSTLVLSGEDFVVPRPADLILVGSAWHWMNTQGTIEAIRRALRPGGVLFVFEYQFPKAREEGAGAQINEWIRRAFNSFWKESDQKPRGSLDELLQGFHDHAEFGFRGEVRLVQEFALTLPELFGVILSQSRYLAYERKFDPAQVPEIRSRVFHELHQVWGQNESLFFSYRFHGVRFQIRSV